MLAIAILAAGKGTRMRSNIPKVLQELSGKSLIKRVLENCQELRANKTFIIVGHESNKIEDHLRNYENLEFVYQKPQNGTGHAIQQLLPILRDFPGDLLVLNGDVPLLTSKTIKELIRIHRVGNTAVSILTAKIKDPKGYGRVFLNEMGSVDKIIEDRDCTSIQLRNNLTNAGVYCFNWLGLKDKLPDLSNNNKQGEIYLTEVIEKLPKAVHLEVVNADEVNGVNDKEQLLLCEQILHKNTMIKLMKEGVRFINPQTCTISDSCKFGIDVVVEPNTHLRGKNIIGDNCHLGPDSFIEDTKVGSNVSIFYSVVINSSVGNNVKIGPFSHIRPETMIGGNCKIGNFVEVKKSTLGDNCKANHLSYLGDSEISSDVNIGAGTITANYDGTTKHMTKIGSASKIGANSVLIAPIKIGSNVTIGAGSTITKDVPTGSLAIERSKQIIKERWVKQNKEN